MLGENLFLASRMPSTTTDALNKGDAGSGFRV